MKYISRDPMNMEMDKNAVPACHVESGETVCVQTYDAMRGKIVDETGTKWFGKYTTNPCAGPIFVDGAEPGDTLKVEVIDIVPQGPCFTTCSPGFGAYPDRVLGDVVHMLPIEDGNIVWSEDLKIPMKTMIGTIGVAPAGDPIPTIWPAAHGGNMDCTQIKPGAALYLPVQVEGALLFMGDVHALMGDGEVMGAGAEVGAEITVKLSVEKHSIPCVLVDVDDILYTVESYPTLEQCCQTAVWDMANIIAEKNGINTDEAGMLCSLVGDLTVCQIVDPQPTVRFGVAKKYIKNC